jgi:hypothetical protein
MASTTKEPGMFASSLTVSAAAAHSSDLQRAAASSRLAAGNAPQAPRRLRRVAIAITGLAPRAQNA